MRESEATTRVREARASLLATQPFFGVLSLKLALVETAALQTMAVTTAALRFNPDFVTGLSNAELRGVVAHEVQHLALAHHARQGARDADLWNNACDYVVNPLLLKEGFLLPKGALIDPRFTADMSAEAVYQKLFDERQNQQQPQPNQKQGKEQPGGAQGQGQGKPQPGAGAAATGSFEPAGPEGSAEAQESERQWRENANEALRVAASAGKLPGSIKAQIRAAVEPKADWKVLLRRFFNDQVKQRSTWATPNKRFPDIYLPGRVKDGMGAVALYVDTSGSIFANRAAVDRFQAECNAIFEDCEPATVHVVYCDSAVRAVETFEHGEPIKLRPVGGGGTRFSPAFARAESEGWNLAAAIYLTDLECNDYPREPAYPVIWASYGKRGTVPPFGETVAID